MAEQARLEVRLDDAGGDAEELAQLTDRLRRELLQLDVDAVDRESAGEAPEGTKAVEVILIGSLIVTLGRSAAKLASVVQAVQGWAGSKPSRTVKLELDGDTIELTGASSSVEKRLVDLWIERHAEPA